MITGKDLRREREARRLSRKQAAAILKVGERTLVRWETDEIPTSALPAVEAFLNRAESTQPTLSEASNAELLAEIALRLEQRKANKERRSPPHAEEAPDSAYYRPRTGASDTG